MKIAYRGSDFHGQARQPGLRTVEGEVLHALVRARAIRDPRSSRFQSASRTDRGVSALGNVVAFDTRLGPEPAVRAFNAKTHGVWAWAAGAVPEDFSARKARERWYRYLLPPTHDLDKIGGVLRRFEGEHDFRNFTRDRSRTVARIDLARATPGVGGISLDFKAPSFRWNLVRRLVSASLRFEAGKASMEEIESALDGSRSLDLGLAPPEPLILMEVVYEFTIPGVRDPTTQDRVRRLLRERERDGEIFEEIARKFEVF